MSRRARLGLGIGAAILALALLGTFAYSHGDQSVRLDFGVFVLRSVPLPVALYGSIILGMLIVLGVSLWSDLRGAGPPGGYRSEETPDSTRASRRDQDDQVLEEADRTL